MSPLVVEFLGVVVRWVITSCGAYLVAKHVINSDQEAQFADGALQYILAHLTIWGPAVVALLWGLSAKYTSRLRFLAALDLPAGASEDSAKALAKTESVKSQAFSGVVGVLLACALGGAMTACSTPASIQTQAGKNAYAADQVVLRIGEFQNAVIELSDANKIRVSDARTIVGWTTTALAALKETPNGWQAIALAGWPKARALANASPQIAPFVPIVDGLLGYQGGQ